jgi:hypothetical protein
MNWQENEKNLGGGETQTHREHDLTSLLPLLSKKIEVQSNIGNLLHIVVYKKGRA